MREELKPCPKCKEPNKREKQKCQRLQDLVKRAANEKLVKELKDGSK